MFTTSKSAILAIGECSKVVSIDWGRATLVQLLPQKTPFAACKRGFCFYIGHAREKTEG